MTARHAATEPWWHVYSDDDRARARGLLAGLGAGAGRRPAYGTLSAGERRRTSIARALMPDPDLLLLDEPAASLDLGARETLIADLTTLAAEPRPAAIVLVSHHVEEIPPGFTHALVMADGRSSRPGRLDDVLTGDVLSRAFGLPLLVERRDGRAWARLTTRERHIRRDDAPVSTISQDTRRRPVPRRPPSSRPAPPIAGAGRERRPRSASRSCWPASCPARRRSSRRSARSSSISSRRGQGLRRRPVRHQRQARPRDLHRRRRAGPRPPPRRPRVVAGTSSRRRRVRRLRRRRLPRRARRPARHRRPSPRSRRPSPSASGCWVLGSLLRRTRRKRRPHRRDGGSPMPDWSRRSFIVRAGAIGVAALVAGVVGRNLLDRQRTAPVGRSAVPPATDHGPGPRRRPTTSRARSRTSPRSSCPTTASTGSTRRSSRRASTPPPGRLRIHGLVDRETTLTWAQLIGAAHVRAVRDDRLRQQRGRRQSRRATPSGRASASATSWRMAGVQSAATQLVGPIRRRLHGRHAHRVGHGPGARADDRPPDERRAAAADPRLPGSPDRARACTATSRRPNGWPSSS